MPKLPFVFRGIEVDPKDDRYRDEQTLEEPPSAVARSPVIQRTTKVTCVESEVTDPD